MANARPAEEREKNYAGCENMKTIAYCGNCGRKYTFHHARVVHVEVTRQACNTCTVPLQKTRPSITPGKVNYFLPFLKVKQKIVEKVELIRRVAFEIKIEHHFHLLEGKRIHASMRDTYARVLALVDKYKYLSAKTLSTTLSISAPQAAAWLERLRSMQLVTRAKRPGPTRMVWYYSLVVPS